MNLVLRDSSLTSLLRDLRHLLPPGSTASVSFRKYGSSARRRCHVCRFCRVGASLVELASLISRVLSSGYRELNVFLVLDEERDLRSTFLLDYVHSLYALVIQTFSRYWADCGLRESADTVGVLNPNTHNLSVLPVHDWQVLLDASPQCALFPAPGSPLFLYVDGSRYVFEEFYRALRLHPSAKESLQTLASGACPPAEHRNVVEHASVSESSDSSRSLASSDAPDPLDSCVTYARASDTTASHLRECKASTASAQDTSDGSAAACPLGILTYPRETQPDLNAYSELPQARHFAPCESDPNSSDAAPSPSTASSARSETQPVDNLFLAHRSAHHVSFPDCSRINRDASVPCGTLRKARSQCDRDREILCKLRDIDCLAVYAPGIEAAAQELLLFDNVVCCGTFDCLHFGHKYLLLAAFLSCCKSLRVGITASDALLQKKSDFLLIQSLDKRREAVERYISMLNVLYRSRRVAASRVPPLVADGTQVVNYHNCDLFSYRTVPAAMPACNEVSYRLFSLEGAASDPPPAADPPLPAVETFELMDMYGPAAVLEESAALVISPESLPGALKVNSYRRSKGLVGWPLLSTGFVLHPEITQRRKSVDKVSSSRIRSGLKSMS
ncbi:pantetheine-phosphate adenylyltransferase [Babesia caballi]|uniref:Pantetheine-phosphate adenylyltransferase n=1 Tax=Babesia caballi TaxID=5871 RepID=A0AAV4LNL9_BABCB|nr:pantetheine-phosphate adenylyltransferase [Babesia caballi]